MTQSSSKEWSTARKSSQEFKQHNERFDNELDNEMLEDEEPEIKEHSRGESDKEETYIDGFDHEKLDVADQIFKTRNAEVNRKYGYSCLLHALQSHRYNYESSQLIAFELRGRDNAPVLPCSTFTDHRPESPGPHARKRYG